jgi:hypothetical protein
MLYAYRHIYTMKICKGSYIHEDVYRLLVFSPDHDSQILSECLLTITEKSYRSENMG